MELFESYDRRIDKILGVLKEYGIGSVEECRDICAAAGLDPYKIVKDVQPIAFENAGWAYTVGAAIAIKTNARTAVEAAKAIGIGLQSFCIPGSVAEDRKVGRGHGNLAAMLLQDETKCFCFLAGHESFAAAEGAIGIVRNANKARKVPLRVILNGLGKDAAQIISRINGFTYVQTQFDYYTGELKIVREIRYSEGERAAAATLVARYKERRALLQLGERAVGRAQVGLGGHHVGLRQPDGGLRASLGLGVEGDTGVDLGAVVPTGRHDLRVTHCHAGDVVDAHRQFLDRCGGRGG